MIAAKIDSLTKDWIKNASDDHAAANGYRFDAERALFVVEWIERYCKLYEGEYAGQPLELQGWQRDVVMRLFGWVKRSDKWGREVRRFRRAGLWVPKKNGKSPTLAAIGLYLLCGDGEQGQKIYSVAKDGKQAMIAHTHAIEMVRRSPELSDECTINKTTGQITHEPSRSFYRVVAGDNPNSQEGLNGSVMVDETHVVDSRLMRILRGAGISRSEPLQLEVSTAGKNPDGYGKQQWDYGKRVESGEVIDPQFFFAAWHAPGNVDDADLEIDPIKYGKMANPSWGRTIDPEEFVAEYQASKRSILDLCDFKMYRLNVWQQAANPWIEAAKWDACADEFDDSEMQGMACVCGLDLSRTRDMTAAVLVFPYDGVYRMIPHFWLPRNQARKYEHVAPFWDWADQGYLTLTDHDTIDFPTVERELITFAEKFQVQQLVFDPRFAEDITKRVMDATGVQRVAFPQTAQLIGPASDDFDAAITDGLLRHNGNPVMTWQVRHCEVKRDPITKLTRPIKPDSKDSIRKIDGVVATIMALRQARETPQYAGLQAW